MFRLFSLLLLISAQIAVAADFTDGNFHFRTISPTECEVYGTTLQSGSLDIPATATFNGKKLSVVKIARSSDRWNDFLGNLQLPESIVTIGDSAFAGCSSLTGSLVIPNSVKSIGTAAFMGCGGFSGSLTIGENVASIGQSAFYRCSSFSGQLIYRRASLRYLRVHSITAVSPGRSQYLRAWLPSARTRFRMASALPVHSRSALM